MRSWQQLAYLSLIFFITFFTENIHSQELSTLRGFVVDSTNGEALSNATIIVTGTALGAASDQRGYFSIPSIPSGKQVVIKVSFISYHDKIITVELLPSKTTQIKIELVPGYIQLGTVETVANKNSRQNEPTVSFDKISIKEIELMPKGVETDIMRSLQFLPGVKGGGDVSARYYVRGGSSDQNLVLLNGVPVYNPFHAMGLFSVIDPEMINNVEFYKGGFTSEFGGRLSSVLNLVTKDGNKNRLAGNGNISFLTGKVSMEGPLPGGSFILTGRKSLFSSTLNKFVNYKDAPFSFYDLFFKANLANTEELSHTKVSVFAFQSGDELKNNNSLKQDYKWLNNIYGAEWFQVWESPLYSETSLALSHSKQEEIPNKGEEGLKFNNVNDITLKMDFTYLFDSRDELKVGYYLKSFKTELNYQNQNGINTTYNDFGANISLYSKYKLLRFSDYLTADAGSRINIAPLSKNTQVFEPRVNIKFKFHPLVSLKAAWGIYAQEVTTLLNENEIITLFEPWLIIPDYMNTSTATHYVAGIETYLSEHLSINLEGYYKILKNITDLNTKKTTSNDPDLISGKGESYGWEFQAQYQSENLSANLAYSLSWAYKEIDHWLYYPRYDSRHSVSFTGIYNLGLDFQFGANWSFSTGIPFTQIEGFYDKLYIDNINSQYYAFGQYSPFTILSSRNLGRLPYYHRLDLSLTKKIRFYFADLSISLNVINAYDRKNIFYFERDSGKRVNMLPFLPTASVRLEI
ncbi:MAG: TonB-dependent receptor [Bacillota bacterium]